MTETNNSPGNTPKGVDNPVDLIEDLRLGIDLLAIKETV